MDPESYQRFTDALTGSLRGRDGVLGLVAVGSMASGPDEFSDHDFLVIALPAATEGLRADLSWLPDHERLVLAYRETAHGVKAVYDSGHLVEFAVFSPDEIALARLNRTRVLFDSSPARDLTDRVAAVGAGTPGLVAAEAESDEWLVGQLLTALLVGVQRHRRGERMSGLDFVHHFALRHLLVLLARHVPSAHPEVRDDLNPFRRVEQAWPDVEARIAAAFTTGDLEETARRLLDVAASVLDGVTDVGAPAWHVVRRHLA